jgi:hypothetical protein
LTKGPNTTSAGAKNEELPFGGTEKGLIKFLKKCLKEEKLKSMARKIFIGVHPLKICCR